MAKPCRERTMTDDALILALVEEAIDSDLPPEEVCAQAPELLAEVKACLNECRNVRLAIDDLFPSELPDDRPGAQSATVERLPTIPIYEVLEVLGRGGSGIIPGAPPQARPRGRAEDAPVGSVCRRVGAGPVHAG